jgi:hypothetical protein
MIFKCASTDVSNPLITSFVTLDGDGARQTIKFKPNDNLLFSVRLPNGNIFDTFRYEAFSPCPPDALSQISAMFSMKRL